MTSEPRSFESTWGEYGAEEWSDALMASMKLGGIDNLFFVSGSEIAFYQESAAKAREREWPTPRLVTMTHEGAALHAALGASRPPRVNPPPPPSTSTWVR